MCPQATHRVVLSQALSVGKGKQWAHMVPTGIGVIQLAIPSMSITKLVVGKGSRHTPSMVSPVKRG